MREGRIRRDEIPEGFEQTFEPEPGGDEGGEGHEGGEFDGVAEEADGAEVVVAFEFVEGVLEVTIEVGVELGGEAPFEDADGGVDEGAADDGAHGLEEVGEGGDVEAGEDEDGEIVAEGLDAAGEAVLSAQVVDDGGEELSDDEECEGEVKPLEAVAAEDVRGEEEGAEDGADVAGGDFVDAEGFGEDDGADVVAVMGGDFDGEEEDADDISDEKGAQRRKRGEENDGDDDPENQGNLGDHDKLQRGASGDDLSTKCRLMMTECRQTMLCRHWKVLRLPVERKWVYGLDSGQESAN